MLLKISGGFDFTPYIAKDGYDAQESVPVEKSRKQTASGYDAVTFATNRKTIIEVKFREGMNKTAVSDCLTALKDAGTKALWEYWSVEKAEVRKAYFYAKLDDSPKVRTSTGNYIYSAWSLKLEQADIASDTTAVTSYKFPRAATDKSGGTYVNPNNVMANDDTFCTNAGALNVNEILRVSDFGFEIPEGSIINSVQIGMGYKVSTTASAVEIRLEACYKGTRRGTTLISTAEPLTETSIYTSDCGKWTAAELNSTDAQIQVGYKRTSSTACTLSIDWVQMIVNYTEVG